MSGSHMARLDSPCQVWLSVSPGVKAGSSGYPYLRNLVSDSFGIKLDFNLISVVGYCARLD